MNKIIKTSTSISPTGLIIQVGNNYNLIVESLDEKYLYSLQERIKELENIKEPEAITPEVIDTDNNAKMISKFFGFEIIDAKKLEAERIAEMEQAKKEQEAKAQELLAKYQAEQKAMMEKLQS